MKRVAKSVLAVSGTANNGRNDGPWCVNLNNGSGNTNANIGSQLSYESNCVLRILASRQNTKIPIKPLVASAKAARSHSR